MANIAVYRVNLNGTVRLEPLQLPTLPTSLDAASAQLPGGAYTTFRTFRSDRALHLDDHLARLEETARLAGVPVPIDESEVRTAVRLALEPYPSNEKRVRLTVDLENKAGTLYIQVEALNTPSHQDYLEGVSVVTRRMHRSNPKAKLTSFISTASEVRQELPAGINEALMVDEAGHILEGLSSNFFAVCQGELWTAEAEVLSGITRSVVLDEARQAGIPVHLASVAVEDLPSIDEAFITSSSRAVLPVARINGQPVGDGKPGPLTRALLARYEQRIENETKKI